MTEMTTIRILIIMACLTLLSREANAQSWRNRQADSMNTFSFISNTGYDRWNVFNDSVGGLSELTKRFVGLNPEVDTLGINGYFRSILDVNFDWMRNNVGWLSKISRERILGGEQPEYLIVYSKLMNDALHNATYLRYEMERHPASLPKTQRYPGFLSYPSQGNDTLTGALSYDIEATYPLWLKGTPRVGDTLHNCVKLKRGVNQPGLEFNDSIGTDGYYWPAAKVRGDEIHRKRIIKIRIRIDTSALAVSPTAGVIRVQVLQHDSNTSEGTTFIRQKLDTVILADQHFKNKGASFDTVSVYFTADTTYDFTYFRLSWPGLVSCTVDWMEYGTARVFVADTVSRGRLNLPGVTFSDKDSNYYSFEQLRSDNDKHLKELVKDLVDSLRGHVNFLQIHDEFPFSNYMNYKRIIKLIRDYSEGEIEVFYYLFDSVLWNMDSNGQKAGLVNMYQFLLEGASRGWVDTSLYADPVIFAHYNYPWSYACSMPKRFVGGDASDLRTWKLNHARNDPIDDWNSFYTPTDYLDASQNHIRTYITTMRTSRRSTERTSINQRFWHAIQAGTGYQTDRRIVAFDKPDPLPDSIAITPYRLQYSQGLRVPTAPELKLTCHLAISNGATGVVLYLHANGNPNEGHQAMNGGVMDWNGNADSMYISGRGYDPVAQDSVYGRIWMGFKERFDTTKSLTRLIRRYGDTLMNKAVFLTEYVAEEIQPQTIVPFNKYSIVAQDDTGAVDVRAFDSTNRTHVHFSIWKDKLNSQDTFIYITNLRTDDSWGDDSVAGTFDRRYISLQMHRNLFITDVADTLQNRDVGKVRTPYVGAGDSLVVWLNPGDGILLRLSAPPVNEYKKMQVAINVQKGSDEHLDHGRIHLDRPIQGVRDRFVTSTDPWDPAWTVPSSRYTFLGIKDNESVVMRQDSLLYQNFALQRLGNWRHQNWTEKQSLGDQASFNFKKSLGQSSVRNPLFSTDSQARGITIKTDLESRWTNAQVKFWDPFFVEPTDFKNYNGLSGQRSDTLTRSTPFAPQSILTGPTALLGGNPQGYGGVYLNQDEFNLTLVPNYAVSAYSLLHPNTHAGYNPTPSPDWGDWIFLGWHREDELYPSAYNWNDRHLANNAIFGREGAVYTARYKSHMTSIVGGTGSGLERDTGFSWNNQRKLLYLGRDADRDQLYRVIWSSVGRIYSAQGYHTDQDTWMNWDREILLSDWEDTTAAYPAISMHWDSPYQDSIFSAVWQHRQPSNSYSTLSYKPDIMDDYTLCDPQLDESNGYNPEDYRPKSLATPAIASVDLAGQHYDVIAWASEQGICIRAVNQVDHEDNHSNILRIGNPSSLHPTLWADTVREVEFTPYRKGRDTIYLAWQQTIYEPGRDPQADTVSDIFAVPIQFEFNDNGLMVLSFISDSQNVSRYYTSSADASHSNYHPCITGTRQRDDTTLVMIAYESTQRHDYTWQGIAVAHIRGKNPHNLPWQQTTLLVASQNGVGDMFTKPSIEAYSYQKTGGTLVDRAYYYSVAHECDAMKATRHWAMDSSNQRMTSIIYLHINNPQLAVLSEKVDSNNYRISLGSSSNEPRWVIHQAEGLYKIGSSDTLFGYRTITEEDTSGLLNFRYGFGEIAIDNGATNTDYEHALRKGIEQIDDDHGPEYFMESETVTLPMFGTLSYYPWIKTSNDSLYRATFDTLIYTLDLFDTNGSFVRSLDTLLLHDSATSYAGLTRSIDLDLPASINGTVKFRRVTGDSRFAAGTASWKEMIRDGRMSLSMKRSSRTGRTNIDKANVSVTPNPFTSHSIIEFSLDEEALVDIEIYNSAGQLMQTIVSQAQYHAGSHRMPWKAGDLPSGVYIVKMKYNNEICSVKAAIMQ